MTERGTPCPYRLLAVDVDGTLMNSANTLSEANRSALHRAHHAGLKVCLCTGRSLTETRGVIDQIGLDLDAGVFVFGAIVSELPSGRTVVRTVIDARVTDRLVAHFQARGYPVLLLFDRSEAEVDYRLIGGERNAEAYERWLALAPTRIERVEQWSGGGPEPVRVGVIVDEADIGEIVASVNDAFSAAELKTNAIYAPNYRLHVVECFAPQVNKWYGIGRLMRSLEIGASEVAAIGDDVNDLEMIREAGLGIAMGNAIPAIRSAADWQVPGHDADGVAAAIDALIEGRDAYAVR